MNVHTIRTRCHPFIKGVASILFIALVGGGLLLAVFFHSSSHAFAASLQQATGTSCVQAPSPAHCDNQDPEAQGCAADAVTVEQANITENGFAIGSVERRFSHKCSSWWGRVFDNRIGSHANMFIGIAGSTTSASPTFVGNTYRILFSPMVFDAVPTQQVPAITGSLEIDGLTTAPSAILPAITIPGQ